MVTLLLAGLLAGCSSGGESSGASSEARQQAPARQEGGGAATPDDGGAGAGEGGRTGEGGEGGGSRGSDAKLPTQARAVIYTSELRVRAENVEKAASRAKDLTAAAGGYVEQESAQTRPPRAEITLRIPAERYPALLKRLGSELGEKVSLEQEAEDVTAEVADVESRVRSAEATLASFRKLLERAETLDEIMKLEDEISDREADLEALQARYKALQQSTGYATLEVVVVDKSEPKPDDTEDEREGFIGGLQDGWGAFTSFVGGLALVFGWLLPFLVTLAVLAVPVYLLRNRLRERLRRRFGPRERVASGPVLGDARVAGPMPSGPAPSGSGPGTPDTPGSSGPPPQ